jgi:hypothetical protein
MTPPPEIRAEMVKAATASWTGNVTHAADNLRDHWHERMDRAITAAFLAAEARGYKLTHRDATDEMSRAAWEGEGTDYVGEHHRICSFDTAFRDAHDAAPGWEDGK